MAFFTGTQVGLQGYAALNQLGTAAFSGFVSAYFNTREIAPLVAGIALAATVGCGFTAQLGAMRISEEVDALEVMAIPSLPFLVTTRIIGGLIAIIPLYVVGPAVVVLREPADRHPVLRPATGTYDHYFNPFLPPGDVLWSFGKVLVFAVTVILIHCYHGYTASGGPAGVGVAVGRAVRTSIVAINVIDLFLSMAIWGATTTVQAGGLTPMARTPASTKVLGVVFLCLLLAGVWLTYAVFTKKFTDYDEVTLKTSTIGLQLPERADVKIRGVIVGEVLDDRRRPPRAPTLTLGLYPDELDTIPAERHRLDRAQDAVRREVRLAGRARRRRRRTTSRPGDAIQRTEVSTEVEQVLTDLYPLLRAVQPAELNTTLNALATALEGRGDQLGENLETLDSYLKRLNPQIPPSSRTCGSPRRSPTLRRRAAGGRHDPRRHHHDHRHARGPRGEAQRAVRRRGGVLRHRARLPRRTTATTSSGSARSARRSCGCSRSYAPEYPCLLEGIVEGGRAPGRGVPRLHAAHRPGDAAQPAARLRRRRTSRASATSAAPTAAPAQPAVDPGQPGAATSPTSTTASTSPPARAPAASRPSVEPASPARPAAAEESALLDRCSRPASASAPTTCPTSASCWSARWRAGRR